MNKLSILVLHGPNLNLLGKREPNLYGNVNLETINQFLSEEATRLGVNLTAYQSNQEGQLVDWIQQAWGQQHGILINAGAYTHTSIAIRDALLGTKMACVEVHLSNIYKRESFRHHSYIADIAIGQISGFGAESYRLGLWALVDYLQKNRSKLVI
ncbi:type II 3-dehydroquinate dehydratase [Microcystis aeruginosa EAWAG127a]|uniref:3-dehydroquinate dehydratase n=1 Tax=Microcystis aeruginosa EAWAG127a TaxID=2529855 RepID=A0A5J5LQ17_MICAE|nr:type II 3-dehydroquinate dehydratase [Microcystis aeruginosa]KAB0239448.1 type II 3-dehydroquinate dehydratase [Microcystis aeruginosa EAWAG127a]